MKIFISIFFGLLFSLHLCGVVSSASAQQNTHPCHDEQEMICCDADKNMNTGGLSAPEKISTDSYFSASDFFEPNISKIFHDHHQEIFKNTAVFPPPEFLIQKKTVLLRL